MAREVGGAAQRRAALHQGRAADRDDGFSEQSVAAEARPSAAAIADGRIDPLADEIHGARARRDMHLDVGVRLLEARQARDEPAHGEGREHADGENAGLAARLERPQRRFDAGEAVAQSRQQDLPCLRQHEPTIHVAEQRHAERRLESAEPVAHRRRGDAKDVRRLANAAVPGGHLERPERAQRRHGLRHC